MRYQFNDFILDTQRYELSKAGASLHIEPQVIELLALLVENRNRMVTKDEIYAKIWQGRFVSESALSSRIKTARQILGDDGKKQNIIRTVHKKGFRFVASVNCLDGQASDQASILSSGAETAKQAASEQIQEAKANDTTASKPAVAILPFTTLSGEKEKEYLADGITSDLIALLSKHRWLNVIARNTSFGYK